MINRRVIPVLQLLDGELICTKQFEPEHYIGDPVNAVRLFNDLLVDELLILDISASQKSESRNIELLAEIVGECRSPVAYAGGIRGATEAEELIKIGFEKIVIGGGFFERHALIDELADVIGSQSVSVILNYRGSNENNRRLWDLKRNEPFHLDMDHCLMKLDELPVGEVIIYSMDRDGSRAGFDIELARHTEKRLSCPVVVCGGGDSIEDSVQYLVGDDSFGFAYGTGAVLKSPRDAVLIQYPERHSRSI